MNSDILYFFDGSPNALSLYTVLEERIFAEFPDVRIKAQKTQITFANRYSFTFASRPKRKAGGYGRDYLIISFGLGHNITSPRLTASSEPYPNRWTHHAAVYEPEEIDAELLDWIREAYKFSAAKR